MAYSQNTYLEARQRLEQRRNEAEFALEQRKQKCFAKYPELFEIQQKLSQVGLNISKSFIMGGDIQKAIEKLQLESLALQAEREDILMQAGLPKNYLQIKYTCDICNDTGFKDNRFCVCHKALLAEIEKDEISKYAPIRKCTFDSFNTKYYSEQAHSSGHSPKAIIDVILNGCKNYADNFSKNSDSLFLTGGTGLGKTHLSLAIANAVIDKSFSVTYGTAHNILNDLEAAHFGRNAVIRYEENDLLDCDLLIIDDLGSEFINQFTVSCVYNIINARILAEKPTIISTNFTLNELEQKYDRRVTSRILNCYNILQFIGNDIRQMKKTEKRKKQMINSHNYLFNL